MNFLRWFRPINIENTDDKALDDMFQMAFHRGIFLGNKLLNILINLIFLNRNIFFDGLIEDIFHLFYTIKLFET